MTDPRQATAREEWKTHWPLVLSAALGISFASITPYAIGLFITPLEAEFGWDRAEITLGLVIFALFAVPLAPVAGAMVDKWGPRRLAIPGTLLVAIAIALFSFASGSIMQWIGLWTFYAFVALAVKTMVWSAAVSRAFNKGRGLALAVVLSGTAVAQSLAPVVAQWLVDDFGWRSAFRFMAAGWGGFTFLMLLLFFRDYAPVAKAGEPPVDSDSLYGLTMGQAARSKPLWLLAVATLLITIIGMGITVHIVPMLGEMGLSREYGAMIAAITGIAGVVGKIVTGILYDRFSSSWIGATAFAIPAIGYVMLIDGIRFDALIIPSMIFLGYGSGATLQAIVYLTGKYGGMRNFGKIFGVVASLIAVGNGLGPTLTGLIYDISGSYQPYLYFAVPVAVICGLMTFALGPYSPLRKEAEAMS